jgi:hypothetical protein
MHIYRIAPFILAAGIGAGAQASDQIIQKTSQPTFTETSDAIWGKVTVPKYPPYPALARIAGYEGTVMLFIEIDSSGRVTSAKVIGDASDTHVGPFMRYSSDWASRLVFPVNAVPVRPYRIFMQYKLPGLIGVSNSVESIKLVPVPTPKPFFAK